ncbi:MAG: LamG domain-containing protein [Candidatus Eisenbacteria bacterium]|uniref:LamG domain-containing protein n=1 Tax=Eiseniibacteriota bacterium TaxID=2212470 RepID=A0A948W6N7_UNCEI|nr:LamG domain-containing protein [Candidatus Eisenbacteria bacterium]MBU1949798.1 LamG domain-containing protein [Candidatus Eisenbacteria bacterium]MBU2691704.1 LamG domain-containing protein [Candidatus Eisenbacteria bacterium]
MKTLCNSILTFILVLAASGSLAQTNKAGITPENEGVKYKSISNFHMVNMLGNRDIPTDGLLAYYPFKNGSAEDHWGSNDGTNHGASSTEDRFGCDDYAFYFDGDHDYVSIFNLHSYSVFSVSLWVLHEDQELACYIISGDDGNTDRGIGIGHIDEIFVHTGLGGGTTEYVVQPGEWIHVVLQFTPDDVIVHVDGSEIWSFGAAAGGWQESGWDIGSSPFMSHDRYNLKGKIDDVRIYDRPLIDEEIQALYNEPCDCYDPSPTTLSTWGAIKSVYR